MCPTRYSTRKRELCIGGIFSLTGYLSWVGTHMKKAAELKTEMINQAGGINGCPIRLIACDDRSLPERAAMAAERLITRSGVSALIGTSSLTISSAVAAVGNSYQIPTMISSGYDVDHGRDFFVFNTTHKAEVAINQSFVYLQEMGVSQIGLLMPANLLGRLGSNLGKRMAEKHGIRVLGQEDFDPDLPDLKSRLARLWSLDPQAIFAYVTGEPAARVARTMAALNMNIPLLVSHGNANSGFLNAVSDVPVPVLVPAGQAMAPDVISRDNPSKPVVMHFNESHLRRCGKPADYCSAASADAVSLVAEGFRVAESFHGADLREAIEGMTGFEGVQGVYAFSPDNHHGNLLEEMVVLRLKKGKWHPDETIGRDRTPTKAANKVLLALNRWFPGNLSIPIVADELLPSVDDIPSDLAQEKLYEEIERNMVAAIHLGDAAKAGDLLCQATALLLCRHGESPDPLKVWITELFVTVCEALREKDAKTEDVTRAKFDTISRLLMSSSPQTLCLYFLGAGERLLAAMQTQGQGGTSRTLKKVFSFIEHNFSAPLTVDLIAREACLSPSRLSHLVKEECNLTLGMCIARARIEKSKKLLRRTDLPICRIAQEVGYPDQSYFTKIFKKLERLTPAEFRRGASQCGADLSGLSGDEIDEPTVLYQRKAGFDKT